LFEEQAVRTPDALAVAAGNGKLTYSELNSKANQLAHYLQSRGIGREVMVGICVERSLEMIVGILGILKAGGAYVPLDPKYPEERLRFTLQESGSPVLLTQKHLVNVIRSNHERVLLDSDWDVIAQNPGTNPEVEIGGSNLAYVIYTSGST